MTLAERAIKEYEQRKELERLKEEQEHKYFAANVGDKFKVYTGAEEFTVDTTKSPMEITCEGFKFEVSKLFEFYLIKTCEKCGSISRHKFNTLAKLGEAINDDTCNSLKCRVGDTLNFDDR